MLISACIRYVTCTEPEILVTYTTDSTKIYHFQFNTYEKGSGFTKLITTETNSAVMILDSTLHYNPVSATAHHPNLHSQYDYIITVIETGKTYSISNIHYEGNTREKDNIKNESRIKCTHTTTIP